MGRVKLVQATEAFQNMVRSPGQMPDTLETFAGCVAMLRGDIWVLDHFMTHSIALRSPSEDLELALQLLTPGTSSWQLALSDGDSVIVYDASRGWDLFSPYGAVIQRWMRVVANAVPGREA